MVEWDERAVVYPQAIFKMKEGSVDNTNVGRVMILEINGRDVILLCECT